MKQALKAIGGAIPVLLLLLWWTWGIRADYKWGDLVIQQKSKDGWVVASKTDNVVSIAKPWTWVKTPVTALAFVNPRENVQDVSGMIGVEILRADYEDEKTEEHISQNLIDCNKKQTALLPEDFKRGDDFSKLEWKAYKQEQPDGKIIEFVCKSIKESTIRTSLSLNEAESDQLSELLRHMEGEDYAENQLHLIREFFSSKTKALGRKLTQTEGTAFFESLRARADIRELGSELALQSSEQNKVVTNPTFDALVVRLKQRGGDDKNEADGMIFLIDTAAEHKKINLDGREVDLDREFLAYMIRASKTYRQNIDAVIKAVQEFVGDA